AQPAEADWRARIVRADEGDLLAGWIVDAQSEKHVGVGGLRGEPQLRRHRSGDLHLLAQRRRGERQSVAKRVVAALRRIRTSYGFQPAIGLQIERCPLRACERPFVLGAQREALARAADVERDARLPVPAGIPALQKMAEEALLQSHAVVAIEMREVRVAVHFQPLLLRAGGEEAFVVAARMEALPAPVRGTEQRRLDAREVDHPLAVVVIDQAAPQRLARRIGRVLRQYFGRQRLGSCDRLAGDDAARAAIADAVLHAQDLALVPAVGEAAEDAAMASELAVVVGEALPDAERRKMRRAQRADLPLIGREVGDAVEADLAIAPRLRRRPFDAVIEIARLARRPD